MTTATKTITVFGIADCHGIESMIQKGTGRDKDVGILNIRAMSNRHRHAVLYEADINEETFAELNTLLDEEKDFTGALEVLKLNAIEVRTVPGHEKSWGLIPNPVLDPWR
jgi:nitrogen regulatory protein PII-like uncharacterized protein